MRPLFLCALIALSACGSPAYREAAQQNTARAYEQFALDHSADPKAQAAINKAEGMRWETAKTTDTAPAWSAYLRHNSHTNRADEARARLDDLVYQAAVEDKDALALERYLSSFPQGSHRKEAREHLDAVRWHDAKSDDTHVSYRRYLLQEPDGVNADKAAKRYQDRVWERAARVDTLRALRAYVQEFPEGEHLAQAQERIGQLTFSKVEIVIALGESWQTDRRAALGALQKVSSTLDDKLIAMGYQIVGGVRTVDVGPGGDPASACKNQPGVGSVVVWVDDAQGEAFEPKGHGTTMKGAVLVYSSERVEPMARWEIAGGTPENVRAVDLFGLYRGAAETLMEQAWGHMGRLVDFHPNPK